MIDTFHFGTQRPTADQPVLAYLVGGENHGEAHYVEKATDDIHLATRYNPEGYITEETPPPMNPSFEGQKYTRRDEVVFNYISYGNHAYFVLYVNEAFNQNTIGLAVDTMWRDFIREDADAWVRSWR